MLNKFGQNGQSLIEMVVVVSIGVLVATALVFATIASLRNSQFAKNQSIATKLAQEGIEIVRGIRDRDLDGECVYTRIVGQSAVSTSRFSDLYGINFATEPGNIGRMQIDNNKLTVSGTAFKTISNIFSQQVQITDSGMNHLTEKLVTVIVKWSDFSGEHESKLSTILTKK